MRHSPTCIHLPAERCMGSGVEGGGFGTWRGLTRFWMSSRTTNGALGGVATEEFQRDRRVFMPVCEGIVRKGWRPACALGAVG